MYPGTVSSPETLFCCAKFLRLLNSERALSCHWCRLSASHQQTIRLCQVDALGMQITRGKPSGIPLLLPCLSASGGDYLLATIVKPLHPTVLHFEKKNRMLHHGKMTIDYHWNTPLNPLWEYPRSYSLPSSWFTGNSYQTQKITLIIDHPRDTTVWWCWKNLLPHDQPFWECGVPFGSASHAFHPKVICV